MCFLDTLLARKTRVQKLTASTLEGAFNLLFQVSSHLEGPVGPLEAPGSGCHALLSAPGPGTLFRLPQVGWWVGIHPGKHLFIIPTCCGHNT